MDYFDYLLEEAENKEFKGWDFSYITRSGRMQESPLKWNYYSKVKHYLYGIETLLDLGTGGGERLAHFTPLPSNSYATESYLPNIDLAKKTLYPLGVRVIPIKNDDNPPYNKNLPFEDNYFELIIDRHEGYYPKELYRILKPGSHFITQQVGSMTIINLRQMIDNKNYEIINWNLDFAENELRQNGFDIVEGMEEVGYLRFYDVGAIAYYMKALPWVFSEFSITNYHDRLFYIHKRILNTGYIDIMNHIFFIDAKKTSL